MSFYDWLVGNGGTPGEYQYQTIHIVTTIIVVAVTIAFGIIGGSKLDGKIKKKILNGVAIFHLAFEVTWRIIFLTFKKTPIEMCWPMYPCNLNGILIPIFVLTNSKLGKRMFYLFGFIGGVLTFALPEGIFCNNIMLFPILKSVIQHTGLLIIPVFEYTNKTYRPSIKDYGWIVIGCLIHVLNCEGIDRLFGLNGDYIFFRSGLPFVIPGVPQFITLSVFAAIILLILSFFGDFKESVRVCKNIFKNKQIS